MLSLPNADVAEDDVVRVVFSCQATVPVEGETVVWGKEKVPKAANVPASKEGKFRKCFCHFIILFYTFLQIML